MCTDAWRWQYNNPNGCAGSLRNGRCKRIGWLVHRQPLGEAVEAIGEFEGAILLHSLISMKIADLGGTNLVEN